MEDFVACFELSLSMLLQTEFAPSMLRPFLKLLYLFPVFLSFFAVPSSFYHSFCILPQDREFFGLVAGLIIPVESVFLLISYFFLFPIETYLRPTLLAIFYSFETFLCFVHFIFQNFDQMPFIKDDGFQGKFTPLTNLPYSSFYQAFHF